MLDLSRRPLYSLMACRAYFDLLKGLILKRWDELGKPEGALLVGILREKWEADLKAAKGTAADAQRKVLAQGKELRELQAAHLRLRENLAKVQSDRDSLKGLLREIAPGLHNTWLLTRQITNPQRTTPPPAATFFGSPPDQRGRGWRDIPQDHETHGD